MIEIIVTGTVAGQGSKSYKGHSKKGHAILVETSKNLPSWRQAVIYAAVEKLEKRGNLGIPGPIYCEVIFTFKKPKTAKKNAVMDKAIDVDKALRAVFDSLTIAGVWEDDARVVEVFAAKRYPNEGKDALPRPGAVIRVRALSEVQNRDKLIEELL